ncbi:MAG: hypothetical protein V4710_03475 [Verrucomicrobiota bacterium]
MMRAFKYQKASLEEMEWLASRFCDEQGDDAHGNIPDSEYDRLFDHLAAVLRDHGTFVEGSGDADFSGYRYVDQIPWITIVAGNIPPAIALRAALEATLTTHRPLAISFDFYPEGLMILPPNHVYATFNEDALELN